MGHTFAMHALRRKRARLAGEIASAQSVIDRNQEALATLDAVIRMFEPQSNPELIAAVRPYSRQSLFFRRREQTRLCLAALREAGKPVSTRWVAEYALAAKGLDPEETIRKQIIEGIRQTMWRLAAKGMAQKVVEWPDTWWELAV